MKRIARATGFRGIGLLILSLAFVTAIQAAPAQGLSKEEVRAWLKLQDITDAGKGRYTMDEWILQNGDAPYYPAAALKNFKPFSAAGAAESRQKVELERKRVFRGIKIREKYDDVLLQEDPTSGAPAKKNDLKGASLSFARDFTRDFDTWSGKGAAIFPFAWDSNVAYKTGDFALMAFGIVPSVSLTKFTTEDPAKKDIDSLIYRVGGFLTFWGPEPALTELNVRGYATYATDTHHRAKTLAGQFDVEPRWNFLGPWGIGYEKWVPRPGCTLEPLEKGQDYPKGALFSYQLSLSIHGEFGEVKDNGGRAAVAEGDFVRAGPVIKLKVQPAFVPRLMFDASYRRLFAATGPQGHDALFEASAEWILWKDEEAHRQVSAKVSYLDGGLELTGEDARVLTAGFCVTY